MNGKRAILTMKDGSVIEGTMISDNGDSVTIKTNEGIVTMVDWQTVKKGQYPDTSLNDILSSWSKKGDK